MHLDTICTMVDVDTVLMYAERRRHPGRVHRGRRRRRRAAGRRAGAVPAGRGRRDGHRHAAGHRHRPRPGHRRTRAVGRRQQHAGHRAPAVRRLRTQRGDERAAGAGRHRGDPDRRLRTRLRPRRPALHVLPAGTRPARQRDRWTGPGASSAQGELAADQALPGAAGGTVQRRRIGERVGVPLGEVGQRRLPLVRLRLAGAGPRPGPAGRAPGTCRRTWCRRRAAGRRRRASRDSASSAASSSSGSTQRTWLLSGTRHQYAAGAAASRTVG